MASLNFNPGKMISKIFAANREMKKLDRPVSVDEAALQALEAKYHLDTKTLTEIGVIPSAA
jgi:hypothetical protein